MVELLEKYNPSAESPSTATLGTVFKELEAVRIPTSSAMVRGARLQGDKRVTVGIEECIAHNNFLRELMRDEEKYYKYRFGGQK